MDLDKIQEMWSSDCKIDDALLDDEALKIPQLHAKYVTLYNQFKLLMSKAQLESKNLKHKKWLYYSGKEVPEDAEPFNYKVIRSDIPNWIAVDEQVQRLDAKVEYYQVVLDFIAEILKQVNNRNYVIRNAIEWRRFTSGV